MILEGRGVSERGSLNSHGASNWSEESDFLVVDPCRFLLLTWRASERKVIIVDLLWLQFVTRFQYLNNLCSSLKSHGHVVAVSDLVPSALAVLFVSLVSHHHRHFSYFMLCIDKWDKDEPSGTWTWNYTSCKATQESNYLTMTVGSVPKRCTVHGQFPWILLLIVTETGSREKRDMRLLQAVILMQSYRGVAVILYFTTEESPFSPQMRALTGLGVLIGLLMISGVVSPTGIASSSFSLSSDADKRIKISVKVFKISNLKHTSKLM